MKWQEETKDLFSIDNSYNFVHCISADFALGKGIALNFNKQFSTKHDLWTMFEGNYVSFWDNNEIKGTCLQTKNVLNLVTKRNYWQKPTYKTMINTLYSMKQIIQ